MVSSVAIRLATVGKAEVKGDFAEIADSGDAAFKRVQATAERASANTQAAMEKEAAAIAKVQALMGSNRQFAVQTSVGTGYNGNQNAGAAQYAALLAQQERQVEAVRAAIDPMYSAQKRYDTEIATAAGLLRAGAISETEHAAAVALSEKALQSAKGALDQHSNALGLNRSQFITAQSAVMRFADAVISGRNPLTAFALEAHKGAEVLSMDDGGMAGGLSKVAGFVTPATIGIAALTAVVAIGAISWVRYNDEMAKLDAIARGAGAAIGVTGAQIEANAEKAAQGGELTVGAARKIELGYVQMGGIGASTLGGLTKLTADFAAATGQSTEQAQSALDRIFQDPIKGAEELASRYGLLSQAQVEEIAKIDQENGLWAAQKKLVDDLGPAFDGAAKHAEGFGAVFDTIKSKISTAWSELGHFLSGVGDVSPKMQQLIDLQTKRAQLVSSNANGAGGDIAQIDAQIAAIKADVAKEKSAPKTATANSFAQKGLEAGSDYSGFSQKRELEEKRDAISNGLRYGSSTYSSDQLKQQSEELEAYTRAINTFIGPAEKKRQLDLADVAIAQARAKRDPAALAAASDAREKIEQKGQVSTQADVDADALAKGERARARLDGAVDKHAATLAREADSMEANARGALDVAAAYLKSSAAGDLADARRKALTDSVKKGIDADAQAARQMALDVGNQIVAGDKATAGMDDQTKARLAVIESLRGHVESTGQLNDALSDQASLEDLVKAKMEAQPGQLAAATAAIDARTAALDRAHKAEEEWQTILAKPAHDDAMASIADQTEFAGDRTGKGQIEIARRAAQRDAANRFSHDPADQAGMVGAAVSEARGKQSLDATKYLRDQQNAQSDAIQLDQAELGLVGASASKRAETLALVQKQIDLQGRGVDLSSADAQLVLARVGTQAKLDQQVQQATASMSELRETGDKFVDDVFNPKGDKLKSLLTDAREELEKMALINPLKNLLLGENNPTIMSLFSGGGAGGGAGGLLSRIKGLFGGGGGGIDVAGNAVAANSSIASILASIPHFASGTESSPAGPAWVNENGQELMDLPQGTKITNAADTRRLLQSASNDNRGRGDIHIYADDAVLASTVKDWVRQGVSQASTNGAMGGATLGQTRAIKAQRRQLGTRR